MAIGLPYKVWDAHCSIDSFQWNIRVEDNERSEKFD
jgi:hypothetical protein